MIGDKVVSRINGYMDERFNEYRGQISGDIAKAVSVLAGIIVIWTASILTAIFVGLAIGFGLSWWLGSYFFGFSIVGAITLIASLSIVWKRSEWVETPIRQIVGEALRAELKEEVEVLKIEAPKEKQTTEI